MYSDFNLLETILAAADILLGVALLLAGIRLIRGPSTVDRIVAVDLIAGIAMSFSVLLAIRHDNSAYLNVAFCIAVIAFIGTVALSLYLEKAQNDH